MLLPTKTSENPSVKLLVNFWAERYTVDMSSLTKNSKLYGELIKAALPEARALTAAKLLNNVLLVTNKQAEQQAKSLYEYIPEIIDSHWGLRITQFASQVYQKLLEVYQQQSGILVAPLTRQMNTPSVAKQDSLLLWSIPDIVNLANEIEQMLLKYQEQHVMVNDWRTVGFLTTLFNFTNKLLINQLTSVEKVLLCPYFKFVEEQVAIPWQRVCAAAAEHEQGSEALTLVEQMLPMASEISSTVYCQLLQLFPDHRSRRGGLSHPEIAHSCLRDLDMFQGYLWLCLLEESPRSLQKELVPLCVMVMPSVGVEWRMIDQWKRLLADEIESRVSPEHKPLLLNYTRSMEEEFFAARKSLGNLGGTIEMPKSKNVDSPNTKLGSILLRLRLAE
ncbi:MAG: hypothetical protein PUP93_32565 [Rhizonema sp. NSF051]|nr:hypothetical protein [Rhizonema sp. NSF051]